MSKNYITELQCPKCGKHNKFTTWDSINVDLNPELREKVLDGTIYEYTCPHCGETVNLVYNFVYHDMTRKFMLVYDWEKPEDFEYVVKPEELGLRPMPEYTFRQVFGHYPLIEKILILEARLDDVVVERMKYCLRKANEEKGGSVEDDFFFIGIDEWDEKTGTGKINFLCQDKEGENPRVCQLEQKAYQSMARACSEDPRMKVEAGQCVDEEWMERMMETE